MSSWAKWFAPLFLLMGLPISAQAAEGDNVRLLFSGADKGFLIVAMVLGLLGIVTALGLVQSVMKNSAGSTEMKAVGLAIKEGALAYLRKQIVVMSAFGALLFLALIGLYISAGIGVAIAVGLCFVLGVAGSYAAGYVGMVMAVNANMRVAHAAITSYRSSLEIAFRSGAVAGLMTVGIGLVGASAILLVGGEFAVRYLVGFGFGGSLAALFMRVGGGIFTKAADVGADLVGKVEAGIPEDDPRNPAVIADNVGDNVGDCAGMAADVFESYAVTLISAIVLASATANILDPQIWAKLVVFAMVSAGIGILASIIGIFMVKGSDNLETDPLVPIRKGFNITAILGLVGTGAAAFFLLGGMGNPIEAHRLESVKSYEASEVKFIQKLRDDVAKRPVDVAAVKAAITAKATELRKDVKLVTPEDVVGDRTKLPAAIQGVPSIAVRQIIEDKPVAIKYYDITSQDLLGQKELKDRGYGRFDDAAISQALGANLAQLPSSPSFDGYVRATAADKDRVPALSYAVASMDGGFQTVADTFLGTGADQTVLKKVRITAKTPSNQPGVAPLDYDQTTWIGPAKKSLLDEQITKQRKSIDEQKAKQPGFTAKIEEISELPIQVFVGPTGKIALALPDKVDRPQQIRPLNLAYFKLPVDDMKKLQSTPGASSFPPQETIDLMVAKTTTAPWWAFLLAFAVGLVLALVIEKLTEYYVSTHKRPVQEVAGVSDAGAAPMIIQGFAYGAESSAMMVFTLVGALLCPLFIFPAAAFGGYELGLFGIAMVGLGLLSTTGYVLAMDTFGPISDNAQGVFEMAKAGDDQSHGSRAVSRLDAAGNTTKALTKGFAIATAVVAAIALFNSYRNEAMLANIGLKLDVPEIFLGMLIGGAAPFLFSAFAINAVGRSSFQLIAEVRRQFRENPGIMTGEVKPDYARCVAIVTASAQKELLGPGILAIALPVAVGFGFGIGKAPTEINGVLYNLTGAQALGGFLAGAILSGQLMAVLLSNSGGMWDNAKKLIEDGAFNGKGSENHKASVVCDTVGDPFKDTAGPALNPLIKVMNLVALLIAGVVITPIPVAGTVAITLISVGLLAGAIYVSKKGSFADDLRAAGTAEQNAKPKGD